MLLPHDDLELGIILLIHISFLFLLIFDGYNSTHRKFLRNNQGLKRKDFPGDSSPANARNFKIFAEYCRFKYIFIMKIIQFTICEKIVLLSETKLNKGQTW